MKKLLFLTGIILLCVSPTFAKGSGGCGHCGGHAGGHCGGHGCCVGHCKGDTTNRYVQGVAWTNDGQVLAGKFFERYLHPVCLFFPSAYPTCHGTIHLDTVKKLVFAGADTTLSYRKDSTEYCHVGTYKYLFRKLTSGKIEVYDHSDIAPSEQGSVSTLILKYNGLVVKVGSLKKLDQMMRTIIPGYREAYAIKKKKVDIASIFKAINNYNKEG